MTDHDELSHTTRAERDGQGGAAATDHDVIVVGGGPAGCSAGVFTARYGLDTLVLERAAEIATDRDAVEVST